MNLPEFIRSYPLRAKNIAWFFGAGASVAAGMPTAWDLVWQFKRMIYCTEERHHISLFKNLADPAIRNQIQSYFDSRDGYPAEDSVEEYSFYFERALSSAVDRKIFLQECLSGMRNSYGHKAIGILLKNEFVKLIFTTNFDKAFENAAIDSLRSMDRFFVATTDNAPAALQKYHEGLRPFITKIHGDYHSEHLKNTAEELRSQDRRLRDVLYHACTSNGLAVMGYSGRDESVMEIFRSALEQSSSYPNGIYWFNRPNTPLLPAVSNFLDEAKRKGIVSEVIEIETFDTAWADIIKGFSNLPADDVQKLNENYYKLPTTSIAPKGQTFPIIRFNAVSVTTLPMSARLLKCDVGNTREVNELIGKSQVDLIAMRKRNGVVGFGADAEFEKAFKGLGAIEKDIYTIPDKHLEYDDSTLKGLVTHGLLKAIVRDKPLIGVRRRDRYLIIPDYKNLTHEALVPLQKEFGGQIFGTISNTSVKWLVAAEIELQRKLSNYFLLLLPTIAATKPNTAQEQHLIAPFVNEAMARWYNEKYNRVLELWLDLIFGNQKTVVISAFSEQIVGYNATYTLQRESPFTKKS